MSTVHNSLGHTFVGNVMCDENANYLSYLITLNAPNMFQNFKKNMEICTAGKDISAVGHMPLLAM